jgi:hypothetical protein
MPLAALLVALAGPIARQVLISLGIGIVTYGALATVGTSFLSSAASTMNGISAPVFNVLGLAGFYQAASIIAGAIMFRISMMALKVFRIL